MKRYVCKSCGYVGKTKKKLSGSSWITLILVIVGILFLPVLVIAVIYSIWRHSTARRQCPECESFSIIPRNSLVAERIILNNIASSKKGLKSVRNIKVN